MSDKSADELVMYGSRSSFICADFRQCSHEECEWHQPREMPVFTESEECPHDGKRHSVVRPITKEAAEGFEMWVDQNPDSKQYCVFAAWKKDVVMLPLQINDATAADIGRILAVLDYAVLCHRKAMYARGAVIAVPTTEETKNVKS